MTPIERLFLSIPTLPSIPRVVQELITTLGDDDADLGALVSKVKQDQTLSARVLRLANSSHYGSRHKVGAIDDAVALIGLNALRTLVIASGVSGAFASIPGIDLKLFWRHAGQSALIARSIGRKARLNAEFAYTAALMHRIGQLLINAAYPSVAKEIAAENHDLDVTELASVERTHLQLDHSEVGAELARRWYFPAAIQNALRWYGDPMHEQAGPYAGVVHLSAQITLGLEHGEDDASIAAALPDPLLQKLVLDRPDMESEIETARDAQQSAAETA
ncbi:HDOD domain-containing protein [Viridibacterium curvum]|uniref:HDOD domain-containing protein n=2 Tax=Viridibacterium curvum TaxID=1101404 RepID=A0ABP9R3K3_9RHOO